MRTLLYSFSFLLLTTLSVQAQVTSEKTETKNDSIKYQQRYGLRLGGDLSKLVRSFIDEDYYGFEVNGDYRFSKRWYAAAEIGFEEKTTKTDYLNSTSKGAYTKLGADFNMYQNWFGMENMIYSGFRVGYSNFTQTINSYTVYNSDQFWTTTAGIPQFSSNTETEFSGLNAIWSEVIIGIKAEVLHNLYVGLNVQFKYLVSEKSPDNFENIYIPGYNRTYDSGQFGFGYGYNISYLIPLYKKDK